MKLRGFKFKDNHSNKIWILEKKKRTFGIKYLISINKSMYLDGFKDKQELIEFLIKENENA